MPTSNVYEELEAEGKKLFSWHYDPNRRGEKFYGQPAFRGDVEIATAGLKSIMNTKLHQLEMRMKTGEITAMPKTMPRHIYMFIAGLFCLLFVLIVSYALSTELFSSFIMTAWFVTGIILLGTATVGVVTERF